MTTQKQCSDPRSHLDKYQLTPNKFDNERLLRPDIPESNAETFENIYA